MKHYDKKNFGSIFTLVRVKYRPEGQRSCVQVLDAKEIVVTTNINRDERFTFDRVIDHSGSQEDVFEVVGPDAVDNLIHGINCCVLTYGQTGSGKTYTTFGPGKLQKPSNTPQPSRFGSFLKKMKGPSKTNNDDDDYTKRGIIPRVLELLYDKIQETTNATFTSHCSFIEIYNDDIYDLLLPDSPSLGIGLDPVNKSVYVKNLSQEEAKSLPEALKVIQTGLDNRKVTSTSANRESSRSHAIFTVNLTSTGIDEQGIEYTKSARLDLVDLAGSERQSHSQAAGDTLKEACKINQSLSGLGKIMNEILEKRAHISYRDSKLTHYLRDSIGGNSKTFFVATVNWDESQRMETHSTLKFANGMKKIKNKPLENVKRHGTSEHIDHLVTENEKLKRDLAFYMSNSESKDPTPSKRFRENNDTEGNSSSNLSICSNENECEQKDDILNMILEEKRLLTEKLTEKEGLLKEQIKINNEHKSIVRQLEFRKKVLEGKNTDYIKNIKEDGNYQEICSILEQAIDYFKMTTLHSSNKRLQAELNNINSQYPDNAEHNIEIVRLNEQIEQLEKELQERLQTKSLATELQEEKDKLAQTNADLSDLRAEFLSNNDEHGTTICKLLSEKEELEERFQLIDEKLKDSESVVKTKITKIDSLLEEIKSLQDEKEFYDEEVSTHKNEILEKENSIKDLSEKIGTMERELIGLQEEKSLVTTDLENTKKITQEQINVLENEINSRNQQYNVLLNKEEETNKQLTGANEIISALKSENNIMKQQVSKGDVLISEIRNQMKESEVQLKESEDQHQQQSEQLKREITLLQTQVTDVTTEKTTLNVTLKNLETLLEEEKDKREKEKVKFDSDFEELQKTLENSRKEREIEKENLTEMTVILQQEKESFENQINAKTIEFQKDKESSEITINEMKEALERKKIEEKEKEAQITHLTSNVQLQISEKELTILENGKLQEEVKGLKLQISNTEQKITEKDELLFQHDKKIELLTEESEKLKDEQQKFIRINEEKTAAMASLQEQIAVKDQLLQESCHTVELLKREKKEEIEKLCQEQERLLLQTSTQLDQLRVEKEEEKEMLRQQFHHQQEENLQRLREKLTLEKEIECEKLTNDFKQQKQDALDHLKLELTKEKEEQQDRLQQEYTRQIDQKIEAVQQGFAQQKETLILETSQSLALLRQEKQEEVEKMKESLQQERETFNHNLQQEIKQTEQLKGQLAQSTLEREEERQQLQKDHKTLVQDLERKQDEEKKCLQLEWESTLAKITLEREKEKATKEEQTAMTIKELKDSIEVVQIEKARVQKKLNEHISRDRKAMENIKEHAQEKFDKLNKELEKYKSKTALAEDENQFLLHQMDENQGKKAEFDQLKKKFSNLEESTKENRVMTEKLREENCMLVGHANPKQRIKLLEKLKNQINDLEQENRALRKKKCS